MGGFKHVPIPGGVVYRLYLDRQSTRLRVGETCHLGIQIGPEDVRYRAVGATAIIEELFKWTSEMKGVWLEVGVSGIESSSYSVYPRH
ncbi:MAG: hypothetical protein QOH71_1738 [Blastocatellia bacterium]|jgi:hypothetical protein|nr:hypothetical protein [Blastocatellia bacterium]